MGESNRIGSPLDLDEEQMRRYAEFQRSRGNDPNIGLRLHVLLARAGLELTDHEAWFNIVPGDLLAHGGPPGAAQDAMLAAGAISAEQADRFAAERARAAADPLTRIFASNVVAVGRRSD